MSTNNSKTSQGGGNKGGKNNTKIQKVNKSKKTGTLLHKKMNGKTQILRKSLNLSLNKTSVKENESNNNNEVKKEDKKENTNQIAQNKITEVKEEEGAFEECSDKENKKEVNPYEGAFEECGDPEAHSERDKIEEVKKEDKKENTNKIAPTKNTEVKEEEGAFEEVSIDHKDHSEQNKIEGVKKEEGAFKEFSFGFDDCMEQKRITYSGDYIKIKYVPGLINKDFNNQKWS